MPMEFLRSIARKDFPLRVDEPAGIDKLSVLKAAGLVEARIPRFEQGVAGERVYRPATVECITPEGWHALKAGMKDPLITVGALSESCANDNG